MTKTECLEQLIWATEATLDTRARRVALMHLARENDATVQEIANAAGLSRQRVTKILQETQLTTELSSTKV